MAPHQPLPIAPRPCPGEILSSWVARFADHYDWTPEEMVALLTGGRDGLADLEPNGSVIGPLAAAARVPSGILYDLDAVRQVPALPRHWFSCGWEAASESRRLRAGYCPWCLRDDSERGVPQHLRIGWALGFVSFCPVHRLPLRDCCPDCHLPCVSYRFSSQGSRLVCSVCGQRLASHLDAEPSWSGTPGVRPAWDRVMAFEEALLQGFHGGDPDEVWMGPATATRFCRAVEDLLAILMDRMTTRDRHTLQLFTSPAFPELKATGHRQRPEYWTGVLSAGWRRTALAAIIQLCAREWDAPLFTRPSVIPSWGRPMTLEWLYERLPEPGRRALERKAQGWPPALAARLDVAQSCYSGPERLG